MSHDLRTPLTAIHALGQVLHNRLAKLQPAPQAAPLMHLADRIVDSAIRMNTWIDDLMAATRADTGELVVLNPVRLDLVDLVRRAVDLANVFRRCQRASNVGSIAGQGIGLAGARQIFEQHGGSVTVQSREGTATTFTVHLPVITSPGL